MKNEEKKDKDYFIKQYGLKKMIPETLLSKMVLVHFNKKEKLFEQYTIVGAFYLFIIGKCKVSKLLENGIEGIISINKEIQLYGEVELFNRQVANTTIEILEESYCLKLDYKDADDLLNDVSFLHFCIERLSNKINQYDQHFLLNMHYSLEQKLCSYILYTGSDDYFKTNYTHLATYLGVTHRHLLRVFRSLIIKEVLRKTDKGYEILNKKELIKRSGDLYL